MAAGYEDLGVAALMNTLIMTAFITLYSVFARQPINARVYYTKWFIVDKKAAEENLEKLVDDGRGGTRRQAAHIEAASYLNITEWLNKSLFMPQLEFLQHAGLDALVFVRLHVLALKLFVPMAVVAFLVLVPINATDSYLSEQKADLGAIYSSIDLLSMSNVKENSHRLWAHLLSAYLFTFWACYLLRKEYSEIANLRLDYLADLKKKPDQFTVLVRQVPGNVYESVSRHVDHFFSVNHPDYYLFNQVVYNANVLQKLETRKKKVVNQLTALHIAMEKSPNKPKPTHKTGCGGCWGRRVDSISYYDDELLRLTTAIEAERKQVLTNPDSIIPAAFVSFRKRWGAAVAAQTQQCRDSSKWITEWAPEPRDVFWANLPVPYVALIGRRLIIQAAMLGIIILFVLPVSLTQSLANLDGLETKLPWLKPLIQVLFFQPSERFHNASYRGLLLVRTPADREKAMNVQGAKYVRGLSRVALYILLGFVYCIITPVLLPFLIVFFAIAYAIHRHQLINVYSAQYESAASYWPAMHGRIVAAMVVHQVILIGLFIVKKATIVAPCAAPLPVITIIWHLFFCKGPYENAFKRFSIEEAMKKDTIESAVADVHYSVRNFLEGAYLHPAVKLANDTEDRYEIDLWRKKSGKADGPRLVPLKRYPKGASGSPHEENMKGLNPGAVLVQIEEERSSQISSCPSPGIPLSDSEMPLLESQVKRHS